MKMLKNLSIYAITLLFGYSIYHTIIWGLTQSEYAIPILLSYLMLLYVTLILLVLDYFKSPQEKLRDQAKRILYHRKLQAQLEADRKIELQQETLRKQQEAKHERELLAILQTLQHNS